MVAVTTPREPRRSSNVAGVAVGLVLCVAVLIAVVVLFASGAITP